MRSYLRFTVGEGWVDESVLQACFSVPDSNPRTEWLHPEQLDAISTLVELSEELDAYGKAFGEPLMNLTKFLAPDLYRPRERVQYSGVIGNPRGWKKRLYPFVYWLTGLFT